MYNYNVIVRTVHVHVLVLVRIHTRITYDVWVHTGTTRTEPNIRDYAQVDLQRPRQRKIRKMLHALYYYNFIIIIYKHKYSERDRGKCYYMMN